MPAAEPFIPYPDQIVADIRTRIADGRWPVGEPIPTTRELVALFGRPQSTVRRAIRRLVETGELRGHRGDAVYVTGQAPPEGGAP
jgi:DNA-binding GntR family transcriptional regulator